MLPEDGDIQQDTTSTKGAANEIDDDEMKFVLCAERYLIGRDIRGIVHLESKIARVCHLNVWLCDITEQKRFHLVFKN